MASAGLYLMLVMLELYWNFPDWQPRLDSITCGLLLGAAMSLVFLWLFARASGEKMTRAASLLVSVALIGLALYVMPAEPTSQGILERENSSPLWYRGGRLVLLGLPGVFWLAGYRHRQRQAGI